MTKGIKPKAAANSEPTNPLKIKSKPIVSPTVGGSGSLSQPSAMGVFTQAAGKKGTMIQF